MEPQAGFYLGHRLGLLGLSLALVLLVLELVRRGYLKERYALLWLAVSMCGLGVGAFPSMIVRLSGFFQLQYLAVVSFLTFLFLIILVLTFTVVISRLSQRSRDLAQEIAILHQRLDVLDRSHE